MRLAALHLLLSALLGLPFPAFGAQACDALFEQLNARQRRAVEAQAMPAGDAQRKELIAIERALFDALERCPQHADLFALMGELQISLGRLPLALLYGRKAVEVNDRSWRAQQLLGSTLAMTGEAREGVPYLERAVDLAPRNVRLRLNLASGLLAAEQYERVVQICNALINSPNAQVAGMAYNLRGQAHLRQGALSEAGRDFAAAEKLRFDPKRGLIEVDRLRRSGGE